MENREKHKYEYAVDTTADTAPARVVRMVGKEQRVLEVGSGPGSITKQLKEVSHCKVTALEIDPVAVELVKPFCEAVHSADLNSADWGLILANDKFDVVLAADVLEHVYDPLAVLKTMTSLIKPDGRVILSLPHVGHIAIATCLLLEDFEYRDWGLLDKTHIRFFGLKNIQDLLTRAGLSITKAEFVVRHPDETEFASKWALLPTTVQDVLMTSKHGFVYQVVLEARVIEVSTPSLNLFEQPVVHPRFNGDQAVLDSIYHDGGLGIQSSTAQPQGFKSHVASYLSPKGKAKIKDSLAAIGIRI